MNALSVLAGEILAPAGLLVLVPLLAAALLAFVADTRLSGWLNALAATLTFALTCVLPFQPGAGVLLVEPLSATLALLTAFTGMATAWFCRAGVPAGEGYVPRAWPALFQACLGFLLLALLADNLALAWGALEAATLATVLVVGLPGTEAAVGAAWKMFLLCGVGLLLAFFGITALHLAAGQGADLPALSWTALSGAAPQLQPAMLSLAFVFLLLGWGTLAALAPLHAWLPDAHARGPAPVAAVLSGAMLNAALLALLRLRRVVVANAGAIAPGPPLLALGLAGLLVAALGLWRWKARGGNDWNRLLAYATLAPSAVAAFAIGLGSAGALLGALLQMTAQTLAGTAAFFCLARPADSRGWRLTLAAALLALAALPPSGLFAAEFLVFGATLPAAPGLALPLGLGLLAVAAALTCRAADLCLAPSQPVSQPGLAWLAPAWLALGLGVLLGFALPAPAAAWLAAATRLAAGGSP